MGGAHQPESDCTGNPGREIGISRARQDNPAYHPACFVHVACVNGVSW
jgi:hypothetical protein